VSTKRREQSDNSRHVALRDLEYAMSLAIRLLHELDHTRAQVRILKDEEDGRMIVSPSDALALNRAVEHAFRSCREIHSKVRI
jgi:hypothetical protein